MAEASPNTEKIILDAVTAMRQNPERYREVHTALRRAGSDQERVRYLLNFATSDRQLTSLMPTGTGSDETAAAITTVTVTTVFIAVDSAY